VIRDSQPREHERLDVWRDAMTLVESVYRITEHCPDSGRFGLTSQMRKAAASVPSHLAEGMAGCSTAEYPRVLSIARGSLSEPDTQARLAVRPRFRNTDASLDAVLDRVFIRPNALIRSLDIARAMREDAAAYESPIPNPESHAR
jgi:four helix bundle protein